MKFSCTRENLIKAINSTIHLTSRGVQLPILNNILIKAGGTNAVFSATNLEAAVITTIRARVEKDGSYTLPAKTLGESIIPNESDHFDFELNETGECVITGGKSRIVIKGASADEYPVIPQIESGNQISVDANELKDALERVVFAAAKNEIRPELSGILIKFEPQFNIIVFAATDSFRLSEAKVKYIGNLEQETSLIIPQRSALEIIRVASSSGENKALISTLNTQISVVCGETQLITRLIEGKYPDYTQIIPTKYKTKILINKPEFTKQVKAAGAFSTGGINAVVINGQPEENTISLKSEHSQLGNYESSFEGEVNGEEAKISLNFRYLLDGINSTSDPEKISLEITGPDTPCVLRSEGDKNHLYIIMPIRQ